MKEQLKDVGIDFDMTLAYNTGHPDYIPLEPIRGSKLALERIKKYGWDITIFTARHWGDYDLIKSWLKKNKIPFDRIVCGKPLFRYLIDDRALHFGGNWKDIEDVIDEMENGIK